MKTLPKSLLFFISLLAIEPVFAQRYGNVLNPDFFKNAKRIDLAGEKSGAAKSSRDLSEASPIAINQGEIPSCVAFTFLYGVFGTEMGLRANRRMTKTEIANMALSPMYMYRNLNKGICSVGLNIDAASKYMVNNGHIRYSELWSAECDKPKINTDLKSREFKPITNVLAVNFKKENDSFKKYTEVMKVIDKQNQPVAAGLIISDVKLFNSLNINNFVYEPKQKTGGLQHFVTVVGFDKNYNGNGNGAFKILNSAGTEWGNDGYCWIPFDVFGNAVQEAYFLEINEKIAKISNDLPNQNNNGIQSSGDFGVQFRDSINQGDFIVDNNVYYTKNATYELKKKNWKVLQEFQILTKNGKSGQSICVFSIDRENKVELHWPFQYGMEVKDQMPNKNIEMAIPPDGLFIEKAGTDKLIVLFSENSIVSDWTKIQASLSKSSNDVDIITRLRNALNGRMIEPSEITYSPNKMAFSTTSTNGDIVPVVLKIQSIN